MFERTMLIVLDRSRQLAIVAEPVKKTGCSLAGRYTLIVHDTLKSIDFADEIEGRMSVVCGQSNRCWSPRYKLTQGVVLRPYRVTRVSKRACFDVVRPHRVSRYLVFFG